MKAEDSVRLLLNKGKNTHGKSISTLLKHAQHLDCIVAFAKYSGIREIQKSIQRAINRGMTARFAVGLSFHLTQPEALRALMALAKSEGVELYLGKAKETFHPKIYAFRGVNGGSMIVGSANLTKGGLDTNHEASMLIEDRTGTQIEAVSDYFDELIESEVLVLADSDSIEKYASEFLVHEMCRKIAQAKAKRVVAANEPVYALLEDVLWAMKRDDSELGFVRDRARRKRNLTKAVIKINKIASMNANSTKNLLPPYKELLDAFHSGGLHRSMTKVSKQSGKLIPAFADIVSKKNLTPRGAFGLLHAHFEGINGAGINLMTEVLHALDNERFAVMNQNAVSGLAKAGIHGYPLKPNKHNVDAAMYASYCRHAKATQRGLGLDNFSELDSVFNYAYWDK